MKGNYLATIEKFKERISNIPKKRVRKKCLGHGCAIKVLCKKYFEQNPDITYRRIAEGIVNNSNDCKHFEN